MMAEPKVSCPNHPGEFMYLVQTTKQYLLVTDVLSSGYICLDDEPVYDERTDDILECEMGCELSPLSINAHPDLLIDY